MEIKKKKLPFTTRSLIPKRAEELKRRDASSAISTSDLGADRKLRRAYVISQATDEELDRFFDEIEPRIRFESEIIILRCSIPTCSYYERNRREAIGTTCPKCEKKAYFVEGEVAENGVLEQASAKEVEAILAKEKAEAEIRGKAEREKIEARKLIAKAGIFK